MYAGVNHPIHLFSEADASHDSCTFGDTGASGKVLFGLDSVAGDVASLAKVFG
jgi:hypothetical protein